MLIMDIECKFCWGNGKINTRHGNDPMDDGEECPICKGAGVVQVDCETGMEQSATGAET